MICLPLLIVWRVSKIVHVSLMIQILVIALAQHDPAVVSEDVYVPLSNHGLFSHKRTYSYPLKGVNEPITGNRIPDCGMTRVLCIHPRTLTMTPCWFWSLQMPRSSCLREG